MKLVLAILFILIASIPCLSQISDKDISASLKSFWSRDYSDTAINPFYIKYNIQTKQVVFFGTKHTIKAPHDSMFIQIEKEISQLAPTLILTEGYAVMLDDKAETTKKFGDIGFCSYSGFEKGIRVKSWDIPYNDMYYLLRGQFSENQLYVLMIIVELSRSDADNLAFSDLVDSYEAQGWQFSPEQKSRAFFIRQYKRLFNVPLQLDHNKLSVPEKALSNDPLIKKYYSVLQQVRDEFLLKTLKKSLLKHDRIFIQGGALHLLSLEKIIFDLLRKNSNLKPVEKDIGNISTGFMQDTLSSMPFVTERIKVGDKKIILFGSTNIMTNSTPQYKSIKKVFSNSKAALLLTQGFEPVYNSEKETISRSGPPGFCRLLGNSKSICVNSWELPWNDVYYALNKKYNARDIYFSLLCWKILRNNKITSLNATEGLVAKTLIEFGFSGYPLVINPNLDFDFLEEVTRYLNVDALATFGKPLPDSRNRDGSQIILEKNGSYIFSADKPGIYNYRVPVHSMFQVAATPTVPLKIVNPDSNKNLFVEIKGSLSDPSTYISVEEIKGALKKCINQDIINNWQSMNIAHLIKMIEEYKNNYNDMFIQADKEYITFIKTELQKSFASQSVVE